MAENKSIVLYDNVLKRNSSISYSGTTVTDRPPLSSIDFRDYSFFEAEASTVTTLDFVMEFEETINAVALYVAAYSGAGNHEIKLSYESAPAVFTDLHTETDAGGALVLISFAGVTVAAGRILRFTFDLGTSPILIRQLSVGLSLEFQRGQWSGATPFNFTQGVKRDNTTSVNGSFLGSNIRRINREYNIELSLVRNDWMRSSWENFQAYASRYTFFLQWAPAEYPDEVAFCTATAIAKPNQDMRDFMSISMPLRCLTADERVYGLPDSFPLTFPATLA